MICCGQGLTVGRPALETVYEPGRNTALFDHLRYWAYPQSKGDDLDAWRARRIALQMNARFPDPLPEAEARKVSWSVASWTWSGGGPMDHSIPAQRRRGIRSGLARRNATRNRDAAIVAAVLAGRPIRSVAREHGLSDFAVRYIVARDAPLLRGGGGGGVVRDGATPRYPSEPSMPFRTK